MLISSPESVPVALNNILIQLGIEYFKNIGYGNIGNKFNISLSNRGLPTQESHRLPGTVRQSTNEWVPVITATSQNGDKKTATCQNGDNLSQNGDNLSQNGDNH